MKLHTGLVVLVSALFLGTGAYAEPNEHHPLRIHNKKNYDTEPLKNGESHNVRYIKRKVSSEQAQSQDVTDTGGSSGEVTSEPGSNVEALSSGSQKRKYSGTR